MDFFSIDGKQYNFILRLLDNTELTCHTKLISSSQFKFIKFTVATVLWKIACQRQLSRLRSLIRLRWNYSV